MDAQTAKLIYDFSVNMTAASLFAVGTGFGRWMFLRLLRVFRFRDAKQRELFKVFKTALEATIPSQLANLDTYSKKHVTSILKSLLLADPIAEQLISLAIARQQPDLNLIGQWLKASNFHNLETLPVDLEHFVEQVILQLAEAVLEAARQPASALYPHVTIDLLIRVNDQLAAQTRLPEISQFFQETSQRLSGNQLKIEIDRSELLERLFLFMSAGNGLIIGRPGVGKSFLLDKLAQKLRTARHACLVIDLAGIQSYADLSARLGIQSNVIEFLQSMTPQLEGKLGVIIFDGYDVARSISVRTFLLDFISRLTLDLGSNWRIAVSVRIYDASKSPRLLELFPVEHGRTYSADTASGIASRHFFVPLLSDTEVQNAVQNIASLEPIYTSGTNDFRGLLKIPFNLWLVEQVLQSNPSLAALGSISSASQLLTLYWRYRVESEGPNSQEQLLIQAITKRMVETLTLVRKIEDIPDLLLTDQALLELLSSEVLKYVPPFQSSISFSHNILFDYAVARAPLAETPDEFIEFFRSDALKAMFLLPSIEFYFSFLWHQSPDLFWRIYWRLHDTSTPVHIKLFARLVPPRIIVAEIVRIEQLDPLIEALRLGKPEAQDAIAAVLRAAVSSEIRRPAIWLEFLIQTSQVLGRGILHSSARILEELIKVAIDTQDIPMLQSCGVVARNLLTWALNERVAQNGRWIDDVSSRLILPMVAKTFAGNPAESRVLIEQVVQAVQNQTMSIEYLSRLVDAFDDIVMHDPHLIAELYKVIMSSSQLGTNDPLVAGIVMRLVFDAPGQRDMLIYELVWYFPRFLQRQPLIAIATCIQCLTILILRDEVIAHLPPNLSIEDIAKTIKFRGKEVSFVSDNSYIWSASGSGRDEPIDMLSEVRGYIAQLISQNQLDSTALAAFLDAFRDYAHAAFLWAELIGFAAHFPAIFSEPIHELLLNEAILYENNIVVALGNFLESATPFYSPVQMEQLENAILSMPENDRGPDQLEALVKRRNRLIARIKLEKLVMDEAKEIRQTLDEGRHQNGPRATFELFSRPVNEDDELTEQGVNLLEEANQQVHELYGPLKSFSEEWGEKTLTTEAINDVMPKVNNLFNVLHSVSGDVNSKILELAWMYLGEVVERISHQLEATSDFFETCKVVLLACAVHASPKFDPIHNSEFERPSWFPAPRISAAEGLPALALRRVDEDILHSIELLLRDPVPAVRFQIVGRLPLFYHSNPVFFWDCVRHLLQHETLKSILLTLYASLFAAGIRDNEETHTILNRAISEQLSEDNAGDFQKRLFDMLPWYLLKSQAQWATPIGNQILQGPVIHSFALMTVGMEVLDFITPEILASDERRSIGSRGIQWILRALGAVSIGVTSIVKQVRISGWTDELHTKIRHFQQLLDQIVIQFFFRADIREILGRRDNARELSDDERQAYYLEIKPVLQALSAFTHDDEAGLIAPHTAHHFMEIMNGVLRYDPKDVLHMSRTISEAARAHGYQYDQLAVDEVVKLVETILADFQSILRDDAALADLVAILDIFSDAGWTKALDLVRRLPDVFR